MLISVVTISYNQAPWLAECIESVLAQKGAEFEYIIVDGGSTDGSLDIIERYRDRFAHVVVEKDRGSADALNKGFKLAKGEILYYLNSDDVVYPGAFAAAMAKFAAHPEADVIYADGDQLDIDGNRQRIIYSMPGMKAYPFLVGATTVIQQTQFMRRAAYEATGGFNIENRTCWDGELVLDMLRRGSRFHYVRATWAGFRVHATSNTGSKRRAEIYHQDQRRLFEGVMGRPPDRRDRLAWLALRSLGFARRAVTQKSQ